MDSMALMPFVRMGPPPRSLKRTNQLAQALFISTRKSCVIAKPDLSPITLSIPQRGQSAVCSEAGLRVSVHSSISSERTFPYNRSTRKRRSLLSQRDAGSSACERAEPMTLGQIKVRGH
jgi:hypothetical protein